MATRSRIGIELQDGSILSAYHHWDGYPTWLGRILETHYNTKEKVSALIDGGDMSSCWTDTVWGEDRTDGNKYGPDGEEYSYIFTNAGWVCYDMNEFNDNDPEIVEIPSGALAV